MRVSEIDDFEEILDDAECQAGSDWEMEFVSDIRTKYERYGDNTYISEKQLEHLEKITGA